MNFANGMDKARSQQAQNPEGNALRQFLGQAMAEVRAKGHDTASWERAAAKGLEYDMERQEFSKPLPPGPARPPDDPES